MYDNLSGASNAALYARDGGGCDGSNLVDQRTDRGVGDGVGGTRGVGGAAGPRFFLIQSHCHLSNCPERLSIFTSTIKQESWLPKWDFNRESHSCGVEVVQTSQQLELIRIQSSPLLNTGSSAFTFGCPLQRKVICRNRPSAMLSFRLRLVLCRRSNQRLRLCFDLRN